MSNMIHYKMIQHERIEDAPFIGALICAVSCDRGCSGCFNQSLKKLPTKESSVEQILSEITANPFNHGIIFGGLEWEPQEEEAHALAQGALDAGLCTMLYTGHSFNSEYVKRQMQSGLFTYIKCGSYIASLTQINHIEFGVVLASSNQHIYKKGLDY